MDAAIQKTAEKPDFVLKDKEARKRAPYFADSWEMELDLSNLGLEQLPQGISEYRPTIGFVFAQSRRRVS